MKKLGDKYMGRFGGGKGEGEVLLLKHSLKIKQSKLDGEGILSLTIINFNQQHLKNCFKIVPW